MTNLHRRTFLAALGTPVLVQEMLAQKTIPYPEEQNPTAPRGKEIAAIARSIRIERDVVYARRPQRELHLDIYSPKDPGREPRPGIVCFSLSAWAIDEGAYRRDLDRMLAAPTLNIYPAAIVPRGYVVVAPQLRTSAEAPFPAQIHDCQCAFAWVLANAARLGIDAKRIGLLGPSASGHLVSLLALMDSKSPFADPLCKLKFPLPVKAVCSFAGMYDFDLYERDPGAASLWPRLSALFGGSYAEKKALYSEASPARYVHKGAPPFFMMHGTNDDRVPYSQAINFRDALLKAKVPVEFVSVEGYGHGPLPNKTASPNYEFVDREVYKFFAKYLKPTR